MGQAKNRGTFEQRALAAQQRNDQAYLERERQRQEAEAALTPSERRNRQGARRSLALVVAASLTAGLLK